MHWKFKNKVRHHKRCLIETAETENEPLTSSIMPLLLLLKFIWRFGSMAFFWVPKPLLPRTCILLSRVSLTFIDPSYCWPTGSVYIFLPMLFRSMRSSCSSEFIRFFTSYYRPPMLSNPLFPWVKLAICTAPLPSITCYY